ncbi:hypothetical protein FD11_GL001407 [Ligilactobacillus pobuzihii E100301 = KCTC 13174]|uniref:Uncharacterized protein n=1 Tax=Ligilactobacillus pobuzihii TaxID=449659 RepID=A0A0R2L1X4_9LACO|nr:hypothetical protein FD11_GL001407 [Ligilactobacillus pobuzihii E100301 = KCTC 13174]KRN95807.1 hypothetical protein IV66_GL000827 [Ligilactobacillus pobuzihii]GEN49157.1 hypothetical protein LPO01_19490 [Ligilactobacillus pobuzihii]
MSFSKGILLFLLLMVATFVVLGYVLFLCTFLILHFNWQTCLIAIVGLPIFLFFLNFLWNDI